MELVLGPFLVFFATFFVVTVVVLVIAKAVFNISERTKYAYVQAVLLAKIAKQLGVDKDEVNEVLNGKK